MMVGRRLSSLLAHPAYVLCSSFVLWPNLPPGCPSTFLGSEWNYFWILSATSPFSGDSCRAILVWERLSLGNRGAHVLYRHTCRKKGEERERKRDKKQTQRQIQKRESLCSVWFGGHAFVVWLCLEITPSGAQGTIWSAGMNSGLLQSLSSLLLFL